MLAVIIGLVAGAASTVQASINTEARKVFRSPFITAGINFTVAWTVLALFIVITEHSFHIPLAAAAKYPVWIWFGGVCAIIIVSLNIFCLPHLGAAGNVMIINFGQIMTGLVIDHFALFGAEEARMSVARFIGAILVIAGMILVTKEPGSGEKSKGVPVFYALLAFICGVACSVQIAVNGTLRTVIQSVAKTTIISMSVAILSTLVIIIAILAFRGKKGLFDEAGESGQKAELKPWMLTGGLFALTVVSGNAAAAPVIGTGLDTIMNLIGMMGAGLVIDAAGFLGIEKKPVTVRKITGMLLMLAGTVLISFF